MSHPPYVLVAGDFVRTGGMDAANHALALHLAENGYPVHLVAHRISEDLVAHPNVVHHAVAKPVNSSLLGAPILARAGLRWSDRIRELGGRTVANGGNCNTGDVNWVHYVHAAYTPDTAPGLLHGMRSRGVAHLHRYHERRSLLKARVVIANSRRTRDDLIERVGVPAHRVHTVYYGSDPKRFGPVSPEQRTAARAALGWPVNERCIAFVGALSDRRKGFDTLFAAWQLLCADPAWDVTLVAVGVGAEQPLWIRRAHDAGLAQRMRFLGFRRDVPTVLAACDALVAPTRYEAYGLAVHEALCRGMPAFVSAMAGVAERYPASLAQLLLADPTDALDLADHLRAWRRDPDEWGGRVLPLAATLRARSWRDMATEIVALIGDSVRN